MASMYTRRCISPRAPDVDADSRLTTITGWIRKMSGKIAIVTMIDRFRRYSRNSLRKIERMLRLGDREHVDIGGDERPGGCGPREGHVRDGQVIRGRAIVAPAVDAR